MSTFSSHSIWAVLAVLGVACHAALFALLHWLEPQVSARSGIISEYGATRSAWIATGAFFAFAAVWLSLAVALSSVQPGNAILTAGRVLFALAVVGIATGAVLPDTADPRNVSTLAKLQNVVARPGLFLGILLVSVGLRGSPDWSGSWPVLVTLAVVVVVLLPITVGVLLERGLGGIGQRAIFLLIYAWVLVVSSRIIALAGRA